ncbi:MAG: Grx4 family monothiol glutaredoxin [Gammaproteobacteria bacterium]
MDIIEEIKQQINENNIILFMKGTPELPQCGFSMQTSQALQSCNAQYAHVDVLSNPDVRQNLPSISNWPTFPQVFVKGELIGGCDIVLELYKNGELQIIDAASE